MFFHSAVVHSSSLHIFSYELCFLISSLSDEVYSLCLLKNGYCCWKVNSGFDYNFYSSKKIALDVGSSGF
jgi:hypothetical protein